MKPQTDDQFNALLKFLQLNNFKLVILEGPRGSGKTTLCDKLLATTDLMYYKTWGSEQKWVRHEMQGRLNLDLPQGTYFVLDFLKQVSDGLSRPILADRGNISALAYQRELPYGKNKELHKYYVQLMKESRAAMLVLSAPASVILQRRIGRGEKDEQKLHKASIDIAQREVAHDLALYSDAIDLMMDAGLEEVSMFEIGDGNVCSCYTPEGMPVQLLEEGYDDSED